MPEITMPRLSDTMEEGTMGRWLKQVGDAIERGEVVAEIESDKATMDLISYETGVLEKILAKEGETVAIGRPVAVVGSGSGSGSGAAEPEPSSDAPPAGEPEPSSDAPPAEDAGETTPDATPSTEDAGEATPDAAPPAEDAAGAAAPAPSAATEPAADQPAAVAASSDGEHKGDQTKVKASPLARARARDLGVELGGIRGSGDGGRVLRADVEAAAQEAGARTPTPEQPATAAAPTDVKEIPLSSMRRVAARRLTESIQQTPHFFLTCSVEVDALLALRGDINGSLASAGDDLKVSVNDLLVRACAIALRDNPEVNVSWAGDRILQHLHVNIGVAVATDGGLIVPVIRDADRKSVSEIAREARALIDKARAGRLTTQEFSGGTFTISNLGMYGIEHFTAIINPPEAALLAVGGARAQPVVSGEEVVIRQVMKLTLAIDHRPLDGASGAQFLQKLAAILENPLRLVI
jgi:pyruvate dehydrogenase E2 component (dihydrolipoamide acetyltransferase)